MKITIDASGTMAEMDLPECAVCTKSIIDDDTEQIDALGLNTLYETCWSGVYVCDDDDCMVKIMRDNATEMCVEVVDE